MKIIIPQRWRTDVVAILDQAQAGTIIVKERPGNDWRNLDDSHFEAGLYDVLADALSVTGVLKGKEHTMDEEGECYSFSFRYRVPATGGEITLYTKLNLLTGGQIVICYSAHT